MALSINNSNRIFLFTKPSILQMIAPLIHTIYLYIDSQLLNFRALRLRSGG